MLTWPLNVQPGHDRTGKYENALKKRAVKAPRCTTERLQLLTQQLRRKWENGFCCEVNWKQIDVHELQVHILKAKKGKCVCWDSSQMHIYMDASRVVEFRILQM